jgi:O-antigen ligase
MQPMTTSPRNLLPQIGIIICFLLMGSWLRFTFAPALYPPVYISRFVLFSAMLVTIGVWFACGMPGFAALRHNRARMLMLLCLLLLALWAYSSQSWGFAAARSPESGLNAALSWCMVALFCVVVASAAPPPAWIVGALLVSAALNALLAVAQVAHGGALGLHNLGEFRFGRLIDGSSLLEAGDLTFVRPYGLLAHPNMLGGLLVVGVLLAAQRIFQHGGTKETKPHGGETSFVNLRLLRAFVFPFPFSLLLFGLLLYAQGLTFSRAAWLALAAGGVAWLGMVMMRRGTPTDKTGRLHHTKPTEGASGAPGTQSAPSVRLVKRSRLALAVSVERAKYRITIPLRALLTLIMVSLLVGALFVAQYRPLIGARAGEGAESLELRSVSDRLVYTDFALRAIEERPLIGQGAGYFPWRASAYLRETFFDLRGDHVHQMFLSVWAELGLVGFALLCAALCLGVEAALRAGAGNGGLRAGLLAGVIALAVVGLFDHYPYSQLPFMALWWGLLVAAAW